jgi:hypothetical protein
LKVLVLILVAAVGIFCAYQVNWIRQRHAFLAKHVADARQFDAITGHPASDASHVAIVDPHSELESGHPRELDKLDGLHYGKFPRKTSKSTFNLLWLFGEPRHEQVQLVYQVDPLMPGIFSPSEAWAHTAIPRTEIDLAERLFPEADIGYVVYKVNEHWR